MPWLLVLLFTVIFSSSTAAQTPRSGRLDELKQLTIEELVDTDVTTASRRIEHLADVAAAVTVITGEDIRRLGVMTLSQALQLAGHLHVARVSGPQYAVSARGFAIATANKMLVMIDGRTVYSPVFAGVFWEAQDVVLQDIDRIEITRGPGGSVWGANAVNGVINVITKSAHDTKGGFVNANVGTNAMGPYAFRYGGRIGNTASYRTYVKARFEDAHQLESGTDAEDDFDFGQAGFRIDTDPDAKSQWTIQGDAFTGTIGRLDGAETNLAGGNLLARWSYRQDGRSTTVQAYFDHFYRRVPDQYRGVLNTVDVDAQQQWQAARHNLVVGAGYRRYDGDDLGDGPAFYFDPRQRASDRVNVFAQDEIRISPEVFVTVGSKFERNEFTGFEIQPTVRARWTRGHHNLWGAISRAVRVPARFDTDLRIRIPGTDQLLLTGNETFKAETVVAYETGYRQQFGDRLSVDVATYVNQYDDLRTQELRPGQPVLLMNQMDALSRGIESTAAVQILPRWQLHAAHTYLWKQFTLDPGSTDPTGGTAEANDPQNIFKLRSYVNATSHLEVDAFFRYVGALPAPAVDAYSELDARLGYRFGPGIDLSIIGSNLLHDWHLEFRAGTPPETYERSVATRVTWRF